MPEAAAPRKSARSWLILPYVLAVIAAIGWCAWWVYGKGQVEKTLARAKAGPGAVFAWKSQKISGFPFRYDVTLEGASAGDAGGLTVATDKLELEAAAYMPDRWTAAALAPVHVTGGRHDITLTGDALRFSISHTDQTPPKISVEGVKVKVMGDLPFAAIDRFELHLAAKDKAGADFFLRIDHATAQPGSLLARIGPGNSIIIGLEGEVINAPALRGPGLQGALASWAQGAGAFNVRQGGIQAGDALLSLKPSTLFPTPDGRVNGELALSLTKASDAVLAMGAVGVLPNSTAQTASGVASAASLLRAPGKPINVTFKFHDGLTFAEGIPLGPAPRLF